MSEPILTPDVVNVAAQRELARRNGVLFDAWRKLRAMDPVVEVLPGISVRDLYDALNWVTDMLDMEGQP